MSSAIATVYHLGTDHVLQRMQRIALNIGLATLLLCGLGAMVSPQQFFRSYLVAYLFWFGIAMGCLTILMIYHITGGAWGAVIRPLLESATRTLPVLAVLFLPIVLGIGSLYEWANPEIVAHDALLQHKRLYLNVPFFLVRAVFYFAVWLTLTRLLNRWSAKQDLTTDPRPAEVLETLSRVGLVAIGLTMTFASIDWAMSLEPHWSSTLYGVLIVGGQLLTAMAFIIPVATLLVLRGPLADVIHTEQFHDLGKWMLAYIMLWAYFALSQFLIIWSANLPEEIPWYMNRLHGGWQWLGVAIIVFHFVLPFVVLLSRDVKRDARLLTIVALAVMAVRFIDLFWMLTPAFYPDGLVVHWMDLATVLGVGGIWLWAFVWQLNGRPLVAVNDPSLPERA